MLPGHDEHAAADERVGGQHVQPDVDGEGAHEGKEARGHAFGQLKQDA